MCLMMDMLQKSKRVWRKCALKAVVKKISCVFFPVFCCRGMYVLVCLKLASGIFFFLHIQSPFAPEIAERMILRYGYPKCGSQWRPKPTSHRTSPLLLLATCHSQVFYSLANARRGQKIRNIGLVRLEQIAPLAMDRVATIVKRYPNAELMWVQVRFL